MCQIGNNVNYSGEMKMVCVFNTENNLTNAYITRDMAQQVRADYANRLFELTSSCKTLIQYMCTLV